MIERGKYFTGRALRLLASEVRGLQHAVYILAVFTLFSGCLALLRDHLFAQLFGASTTFDIYNAAFRIPDLLFVIMGALVSVYILIPQIAKRSHAEQKDYIDTIIAGFSLLSIIVCGFAALFAPFLLTIFFPKLVARGLLSPLVVMTRIMLLQPVFFGFSNIFAAITQLRHRYILYAISPLLYNLGIMLGAVLFYPAFGAAGLAFGVAFGALMHAGIQLPSIVSDGFFRRVPRLYDTPALVRSVATSIPRALALSMSEIAELGLVALAGLLVPGSISVFFYAYNLQNVPLSVIGASYSIAAFPGLAAALARGERTRFIENVATAARYVMFWSLPVTAIIVVLRAHIVRVVLGSGAFNWTDTRLTAAAFGLFALSLAAQGIMLLIVRAYYAAGRSFVPFFISSCMAIATIAIGAASVGALHNHLVLQITEVLLRVVDVPGVSVLALAFAFSFASIGGAIVLVVHFEMRFHGFLRLVARSWLESLCAALAGGMVAYIVLNIIGPITLVSTTLSVFFHGMLAGIAGIGISFVFYAMLSNQEYEETALAFRNRIPAFGRRAEAIAPEVVPATEEQQVLP